MTSRPHLVVPHRLLADEIVGGVSTVYRELVPRLCKRGIRVTTMAPNPCAWSPNHVVVPPVEDAYDYASTIADAVADLGPTVTECSSWEFELLAYARRARYRRAPVVVRSEFAVRDMQAWHLVAGEGELLRSSDAVLAVSHVAASSILDAYDGIPQPVVVHNGVDRAVFRPEEGRDLADVLAACVVDLADDGSTRALPPAESRARVDAFLAVERPTLVWVGKATYMKGWPLLREIAYQLADRVRCLVVFGHAPAFYPVDLPPAPAVLAVQDVPLDAIAAVYSMADWFLCTSNAEGYGLAMAEAVSCGTPVLAPAALDVVWEFLEEGVDGVRYSTVADIEAIVDGAPPRPEGVHLHSWDDCANRTVDAYRAVGGLG